MSNDAIPPETPPAAPEGSGVSPARLVVTLSVAGALAGLLLVFADLATRGAIEEHARRALQEAIQEVLGEPSRVVSLRVEADGLVVDEEPVFTVDADAVDRVFLGFGEDGTPKGFAVLHQRTGFQDKILVIFGYDPRTKTVLGMKVLESLETPGLGDKIEAEPFVGEFEGVEAPVVGVKTGRATGAANEVDMVTGATISSKAVIKIINSALGMKRGDVELRALLEAHLAGGARDE